MIVIRECKPEICELYSPNDEFIGIIPNYESFNDIRIQIAENKLQDYYAIWNGIKIEFYIDASTSRWPNGMYDKIEMQLSKIIDFKFPR